MTYDVAESVPCHLVNKEPFIWVDDEECGPRLIRCKDYTQKKKKKKKKKLKYSY